MCLYTSQICPIKARKDIVCYKVVKRHKHATKDKKYMTPCMKKPLRMHSIINAAPPKHTDKILYLPIYLGKGKWVWRYEVNGGWIHTCNTLDDAKLWLKKNYHLFNHNRKRPFHWAIIECVIHKGVLYYRSFDRHTLCSKEIFTREIVLKGLHYTLIIHQLSKYMQGLKEKDILPHEYIKLFKERCERYISMCDVVLSCDQDSEYANAFIKKIMEEHNFIPGQ